MNELMNMKITKEDAVRLHRKMWGWIVDETLLRKIKITKEDFFEAHPWLKMPSQKCYCCQYARQNTPEGERLCNNCPLDWGKYNCVEGNALYDKWRCVRNDNYLEALGLAFEIMHLPEKED